MRRNIDTLWPHIEQGAEAIVSTASGCGLMLKVRRCAQVRFRLH